MLNNRLRKISSERVDASRQLRRSMTPAESILWDHLRARQLDGLKFRRQYAYGPYILDFYCAEPMLIVEVDGSSHDDRTEYDHERDRYFEQLGCTILRIRNEQIVNDLSAVLDQIRAAATICPHP